MTYPAGEPDEQRAWVSTTIAARALGCSDETVKRRIRSGNLEGGRRPNGYWYVYKDQLASDDEKQLRQQVLELRRQLTRSESGSAVEELRAHLATAEIELDRLRDTAQSLEAENRELRRANQVQQAALSDMQEVLDEYLEAGESALNAAGKFRSAGKKLSRINASLNEHLALSNIPDTPAELDDNF